MIFVRYYRNDLVTGQPDIEVAKSVLNVGDSVQGTHATAIEYLENHKPDCKITAYQLFEGDTFATSTKISLRYMIE